MEPQPQKSVILPVALSVLLSALVFGGGGYYLGTSSNQPSGSPTPLVAATSSPKASISPEPSVSPSPDVTASWKTYTNTTFGFSLKYPPEYTVTDNLQKDKAAYGKASESLVIKSDTVVGKPSLTMWINPDGFDGPVATMLYYTKINPDGTLTVASKEKTDAQEGNLGYDPAQQNIIVLDSITRNSGLKISSLDSVIRFNYATAQPDLAKTFDQMLATVKITK